MSNKFSKSIYMMIMIYMALPVTIFILGWVKLWISIPFLIVLGYTLFKLSKDHDSIIKMPEIGKKEIETMLIAFLIILVWVYCSGIGKFVFQNDDHLYRNGLFEMLVKHNWPVIKEFAVSGGRQSFLLVYYIGFWMPSAVVGKLFGLTAGFCFQALWSAIGIWIFYYLLCCYLKRVSLMPFLVFIFFSGLDAIGAAVLSGESVSIFSGSHLEWYCGVQFSSFTTQLFWVFNQSIPAWILTMLVLMQHKNQYLIFLLGISLIFCPLPFIGILPLVMYKIVRNAWSTKNIKEACKDLFTIENIFGGGITGITTYLYFKTNSSGQHVVFLPGTTTNIKGFIFNILFFIILEVGIYYICIYKYQKKNPLFYITFAFLCTCPLIQIGYGGDYCMRASIPCIVVLYLMVIETLLASKRNNDLSICVALTIILALGAVTPIHEINRTVQSTENSYKNGVPVYAKTYTDKELMMGKCGNNFRGELGNSIFTEYLMRSNQK